MFNLYDDAKTKIKPMLTISLHEAEFFSYHGFYPEEQKLGSKFMVDVEVSLEANDSVKGDEISNTVDYEQVYDIVCVQMKQTRKLIETVGQAIAGDLKQKFPLANNIKVVIKKLNPPLGGRVAYSSITVTV